MKYLLLCLFLFAGEVHAKNSYETVIEQAQRVILEDFIQLNEYCNYQLLDTNYVGFLEKYGLSKGPDFAQKFRSLALEFVRVDSVESMTNIWVISCHFNLPINRYHSNRLLSESRFRYVVSIRRGDLVKINGFLSTEICQMGWSKDLKDCLITFNPIQRKIIFQAVKRNNLKVLNRYFHSTLLTDINSNRSKKKYPSIILPPGFYLHKVPYMND